MANRTNSQDTVAFQHHPVASRTNPGNQVNVAIGHNISSARKARRISFGKLAAEAKIEPDALAAYEDGCARPSAGDLLAIATCIGVPVSTFFTGL